MSCKCARLDEEWVQERTRSRLYCRIVRVMGVLIERSAPLGNQFGL